MIPVYKETPNEWDDEFSVPLSGKQVAEGYIRFFEPDVYVEAEGGLLEEAGLAGVRGDTYNPLVVPLDKFFDQEYRGIYEPAFGQGAFDIIDEAYQSERRFQLRDEHFSYCAKESNNIFAELCIGVYPEDAELQYISDAYKDVFRPEPLPSSPDTWLKIFFQESVTPFSIASKHLDIKRTWADDPVIYVFDPSKTTDLIDLWNLRIQPSLIYPVPVGWVQALAPQLCRLIRHHHRPLRGNKHGVMHHTTLEVSRSITEKFVQKYFAPLFRGLPQGALLFKHWRTRVWDVDYEDRGVKQPDRIVLISDEIDQLAMLKEGDYFRLEIDTISPSFSKRFSGSKKRWANVLSFSDASIRGQDAALCIPFNTFDRGWPKKGLGDFNNGREGWVFLEDFQRSRQTVPLLKMDEAFIKWFELRGVDARLSEAGRIAKQVIESLEGIWGLYLFDDEVILKFINRLANSVRKLSSLESGEVREEEFSGRTASIGEFQGIIARRKSQGSHDRVNLSNYIDSNVIKIGLETVCDYCQSRNWHGLDEASYSIRCIRCLKEYEFPQANIKQHNQNWKYRVVGPFAVPDYAQGAYAALLTIRFFTWFWSRNSHSSYSTAIELSSNGRVVEVDFAIWVSDQIGFDARSEPRLIMGEAKSFAVDAVKNEDLEQLKISAGLFPGSILVISVLKDRFSEVEIERLRQFVTWSRKSDEYGPKHWVVLLTATELFEDFIEIVWKEKGEPYSKYANYLSTKSLEALSDSTLAIYLDEKPYHEWHNKEQEAK